MSESWFLQMQPYAGMTFPITRTGVTGRIQWYGSAPFP